MTRSKIPRPTTDRSGLSRTKPRIAQIIVDPPRPDRFSHASSSSSSIVPRRVYVDQVIRELSSCLASGQASTCRIAANASIGIALGAHLHADRVVVADVVDRPQHERIIDLAGRRLVAARMIGESDNSRSGRDICGCCP